MGNRIFVTALAWYFASVVDDHMSLITMLLAGAMPTLLFGVIAGPFIDRWRKKSVLVVCDLLSCVLTFALAMLIIDGFQSVWWIHGCVFGLSVVSAFFNPATRTIIPSIVTTDELQAAMSMQSMTANMAQFVGAAVGGVLVVVAGVAGAILINAASFLFCAFLELLLRVKDRTNAERHGVWKELAEGFRQTKMHKVCLRLLVLSSVLNIFIVPIVVFLPIIVDDELHLGAGAFGMAQACLPIGSMAIALILSGFKKRAPLSWVRYGFLVLPIGFLMISVTNSLYGIMTGMAVLGIALSAVNINSLVYFTTSIQSEYHGRFFSVMEAISFGMFPLGYLASSMAIDRFPIYHLVLANGIAILMLAIVGLVLLRERRT
jgi:MFS family permease